jgi:hypothetical protein
MAQTKASDDELIAALEQHGSLRKAAKALGINLRTLVRRKMRLVARGYSPKHDMTHLVPEGYRVRGVSTLYDGDGKPRMQWVKSAIDPDQIQAITSAAVAGLSEEIPREPARPVPRETLDDLLNQYTITDYHLGMLAWGEETGADWDLSIAENLLVDWFALAIKAAPEARFAVFAQLGDFLHWDGLDAVTPAHHNLLDADTRFQKLVRVAIRVIRRVIAMLLDKHEIVYVLMAEGNHDPASSIWLRELLHAMYEHEPRVIVELSPDPYYCIEHGLVALFYHHGHKRKVKDVDAIFAGKFREVFGRTKFAYAHMGHLHSVDVKETPLMLVEQHRTLAAPDAYASRGGWLSGRDAQVITYSKRFGEVGRVRVSSLMVERSA